MEIENIITQKIERLALDTIHLARNTLLVNLRFLDMSINQLELQPLAEIPTFATDGQYLYFNAWHVLSNFKNDQKRPARDFLHVIFHCLFHHAFVSQLVHQGCWDLACDITVENAINDLGLEAIRTNRQISQVELLEKLRAAQLLMTAEKLYRHFLDQDLSDGQLLDLRRDFYADDHTIWYQPVRRKTYRLRAADGEQKSGEIHQENPQYVNNQDVGQRGKQEQKLPEIGDSIADQQALQAYWKEISKRAQVDLETFSKKWGDQKGSLQQSLNQVTREKYDYAAFLKRFSVMGEAMQINDEEFDLVFYTYGLRLYENMPLIEPLETKEVKRIREFVIAIDTSGSVHGELVQAFIQKTYNILMQTENFFRKINIHIIQCDADIQHDVKITNPEEFKDYFQSMTLQGFGGTDFRPVFNYVDQLIDKQEFTNLKGLIYFTDGYGTYPEREPDYSTAFVFLDESTLEIPEVPYWAIKLVLNEGEIKAL